LNSSTQHQVPTVGLEPTSGQDAFFGCRFAPQKSPPQDHSGVAGGFTWRVGEELEGVCPQQVWRAGRETLKSSTQSQVPTLGLEPPSGQDVFWGADLPPKRALREIIPGWLGASLGAECLISRSPSQHARLTEGIQPLTSHQRAKCSPQRN